jgi:hypothetical protein
VLNLPINNDCPSDICNKKKLYDSTFLIPIPELIKEINSFVLE